MQGAGPPLLLLHGGLSDAITDFGTILPELAAHFRVIAMDTRGHGRSTWGGVPLSYRGFAEDAAALLAHLDVASVSVLGLSDGGISGLHLARWHPRRVVRLITIGASTDISGDTPLGGPMLRQFTAAMYAMRQPGHLMHWRAVNPEPDAVLPFIEALMTEVWRPPVYLTPAELEAITVPVAIVIGDHDEYVTTDHAAVMHQRIPGSVLKVVPDSSHLILESNPTAARTILRELLGY